MSEPAFVIPVRPGIAASGPAGHGAGGLDALLHPRVIAVVGASRDPAKWGRRILEYTCRAGYRGALYGVNPAVADLGLPSVTMVPALAEIGQPIDLAVLARPASMTPDLVDECAALGVRAVLITAAGFGELGGENLAAERRIADRARAAGMRILGPNTFGMFVAADGINLTPREHIPTGKVALLSQSGNVVVAMYEQAKQAGVGFSACVGVGNQIDVGLGELLGHFAADPASAVVAMYVEGLRGSGEQFRAGLDACRAAGKPVVVLKSGRSAQAASAIATHTGALASDGKVWQAVLDSAGAIAVDSTQDMTDLLAVLGGLRGRGGVGGRGRPGRAMVLTDGGGDSVLAIDSLTGAGLTMATPSAQTRAKLDKLIPQNAPRTPARNPLTLDTAGGVEDDPTLLARCARLAAQDDDVDVIVVGGLFGGYPRMLDAELACAAELVELHGSACPVAVQSAFALSDSEPVKRLKGSGVAVLPTADRLARALARALAWQDESVGQAEPGAAVGQSGGPGGSCTARTESANGDAADDSDGHDMDVDGHGMGVGGPVVWSAERSAGLLREHGITLPPMTVVRTADELAAALPSAWYPACVKIADEAVSHKSDVGGVRLNLADAGQLQAAAVELWGRFPGSPLLVMPSLRGGAELLVGAGTDPLFGPYALVGRGGIWAETDPDVAIVMAPVTREAATRALLSLRCAPTFTGRRGQAAIDVAAVADLVASMASLAAEHPDLSVEANPVIAYPDGYAIADLRAAADLQPPPAAARRDR